jgi:hypothetical protein
MAATITANTRTSLQEKFFNDPSSFLEFDGLSVQHFNGGCRRPTTAQLEINNSHAAHHVKAPEN